MCVLPVFELRTGVADDCVTGAPVAASVVNSEVVSLVNVLLRTEPSSCIGEIC